MTASVRGRPRRIPAFAATHAACVLLASLFTICRRVRAAGHALGACCRARLSAPARRGFAGSCWWRCWCCCPPASRVRALVRTVDRHPDSPLRFLPPSGIWGCIKPGSTAPPPRWPASGALALPAIRRSLLAHGDYLCAQLPQAICRRARKAAAAPPSNASSRWCWRCSISFPRRLGISARMPPIRGPGPAAQRNPSPRPRGLVGLGWLLALHDIANAPPAFAGDGALPAVARLRRRYSPLTCSILGLRVGLRAACRRFGQLDFPRDSGFARKRRSARSARRIMFSFLIPVVALPDIRVLLCRVRAYHCRPADSVSAGAIVVPHRGATGRLSQGAADLSHARASATIC